MIIISSVLQKQRVKGGVDNGREDHQHEQLPRSY